MNNSDNLLIIFTRNPEIGKVKTRLAKKTGNQAALEIYNFLLRHTVAITKNIKAAKSVYYSDEIWQNDLWSEELYDKKLQSGPGLGERMENAFREGFSEGYKHIVIIGSDLFDIQEADITEAFEHLSKNEFVIGPAQDGGYYLLGMNSLNSDVFKGKNWGSSSVLGSTLNDLKNKKVKLLEVRNDIDVFEDLKGKKAFRKYLK
ncbi:TIGR04282 family arsenosugar biosynthesis glycosyltransferase [Salegentibacter chungangensis]|uniref:TIGR04282 family arsenosugar biosynthesis glycosyltransferase n=1 Tax=Salegentibacter chungangensis TaxID=1335724 RepID=A0ABW3NQJ8_9FLAO